MLRVLIPTESGNEAVRDGSLGKLFEDLGKKLKPEASYFLAQDGLRSALFFFDLKDVAEIPTIAEPLFIGMGAELELVPVMNAEELKQGLGAYARGA
jgi:hypothetical protein